MSEDTTLAGRLGPQDKMHFDAAEGWFELGNMSESMGELDRVEPRSQTHPDVLELRWQIYAKTKNWLLCVDIGKALSKIAPKRASSWIHWAYSLHELKRTKEAWDVLFPVASDFPQETTISYNLACYACQMGNHDQAREWLKKAFIAGDEQELRMKILNDPDLAPLMSDSEPV